jgi:hypothetical protein
MHIPQDIIEFVLRWRRKGQRYNYDRLEDCFDGFFTAFVLYNFLYDLICDYERSRFPQTGDRKRATEVVRQFLGSDALSSDPNIRAHALAIKGTVESGTLYVRDAVWDAKRVRSLGSSDPVEWAQSVLDILYQIRCNTFHGSKSFNEDQRVILIPCIRILEAVNDMLIERTAPNQTVQRTGTSRFARSEIRTSSAASSRR